jgi:hypothetical protein
MSRYGTALLAAVASIGVASAEVIEMPPPSQWTDRIYWGGGVGATFGDYDSIYVAPMVGYAFTPKVSGGLAVFYLYQDYNDPFVSSSTDDYGFDLFARYRVTPQFFAQGQYSYTNQEIPTAGGGSTRDGYQAFLAGGGFVQPMGGRAAFVASVLYDFSWSDDEPAPYTEPWVVTVGVSVGF